MEATIRAVSGAEFDIAVVGAGVVGCAVAHRLSEAGHGVVLLEREARAGTVTSSRNSGVIHGGLYYPAGSRKARTCVDGNRQIYAWAKRHGVPHAKTGKLVVARDAEEADALEALLHNAEASGARGCRLLSNAELRRLEPQLPPSAGALLSTETGIIDPHALTRSYLAAAERGGATFVHDAALRSITQASDVFSLDTERGETLVRTVINCAGLFADEVAAMVGLSRPLRACRGDYFRLATRSPYSHLIYPVKRPRDPGLGVHLTLDLDGGCRLGPDWTWVDDKNDYTPRPDKHAAFLAAARRLLGDVEPEQLSYDSCGLRPKLVGPGEAAADFVIEEHPTRVFHLLGIESPGLTAALALADDVVKLVG